MSHLRAGRQAGDLPGGVFCLPRRPLDQAVAFTRGRSHAELRRVWAAGRVVRWVGTRTDIHDRKLAEQAGVEAGGHELPIDRPARGCPYRARCSATRKPRLPWQKCGGSALRVAHRASAATLLQPPPRTAKPRAGSPSPSSTVGPFGYGP